MGIPDQHLNARVLRIGRERFRRYDVKLIEAHVKDSPRAINTMVQLTGVVFTPVTQWPVRSDGSYGLETMLETNMRGVRWREMTPDEYQDHVTQTR